MHTLVEGVKETPRQTHLTLRSLRASVPSPDSLQNLHPSVPALLRVGGGVGKFSIRSSAVYTAERELGL